jgi:Clp amino terminal domain, pathogenicity island component
VLGNRKLQKSTWTVNQELTYRVDSKDLFASVIVALYCAWDIDSPSSTVMFQRFTEKARRVIFFARYEAGAYGSHYIETEHLLLGLLREAHALLKWFPGEYDVGPKIRAEIEKRITRGERLSTSVEVPLTQESKRVLKLAEETSDRFGHREIEPVHLLIGLLRVESSMAAQILIARGVKSEPIQEDLAKRSSPDYQSTIRPSALLTVEGFLAGLKGRDSGELILYFATNAEVIDASGTEWNLEEIGKSFEMAFAPYAKRNTSYAIEKTLADTNELFIATVLWSNALLASEQRSWIHRMTVVLCPERDEWRILLVQATAVQSH